MYFPGLASGINTTDGAPTVEIRIAKLLEKYDMQWVLREHPWPRPGDGGAPLLDGMDPGQMTKRPG